VGEKILGILLLFFSLLFLFSNFLLWIALVGYFYFFSFPEGILWIWFFMFFVPKIILGGKKW